MVEMHSELCSNCLLLVIVCAKKSHFSGLVVLSVKGGRH